jgi:hypothetical protein
VEDSYVLPLVVSLEGKKYLDFLKLVNGWFRSKLFFFSRLFIIGLLPLT